MRIFILSLIVSYTSYSQITFEQGYYINNNNERVEGYIKNLDRKNNPTKFDFKKNEADNAITLTIDSVEEFGVLSISKYKRFTVNIDKSRNEIGYLTNVKHPIFSQEKIFLKYLIEGPVTLYEFEESSFKRFFYNLEGELPQQLIYKKYLSENNHVAENVTFRQQLLNSLKCSSFTTQTFVELDYTRKSLVLLFKKYYECTNRTELVSEKTKSKTGSFNLSIRPGMIYSTLSLTNPSPRTELVDFGGKVNPRIGLELEFVMPFNKNKWAVFVEPNFHQFKAETKLKFENAKVNYSSIEVPIGLRHYLFLNKNSSLSISVLTVFNFNTNSEVDFSESFDLKIKSTANMGIGIGYKYNRYSFELRGQSGRDLLIDYISWTSSYKSASVIFGYKLL